MKRLYTGNDVRFVLYFHIVHTNFGIIDEMIRETILDTTLGNGSMLSAPARRKTASPGRFGQASRRVGINWDNVSVG
jgi:hypothetical protein